MIQIFQLLHLDIPTTAFNRSIKNFSKASSSKSPKRSVIVSNPVYTASLIPCKKVPAVTVTFQPIPLQTITDLVSLKRNIFNEEEASLQYWNAFIKVSSYRRRRSLEDFQRQDFYVDAQSSSDESTQLDVNANRKNMSHEEPAVDIVKKKLELSKKFKTSKSTLVEREICSGQSNVIKHPDKVSVKSKKTVLIPMKEKKKMFPKKDKSSMLDDLKRNKRIADSTKC